MLLEFGFLVSGSGHLMVQDVSDFRTNLMLS